MFILFWWVINIILDFLTNTVLFFSYFLKILLFDTDYEKYAIVEISRKKEVICDTDSINIWIWDDAVYRFIDFSNITSTWRHNDFILDMSSDLRSEYQI